MTPPSGSHPFHIHTLEPVERHRGELVDVTPVAGQPGQSAAAARDVAGLSGVVFGHIVEIDGQRGFFLEDVKAADDELRLVGLFNKWADGPLGLVGESDGLLPSDLMGKSLHSEEPANQDRRRIPGGNAPVIEFCEPVGAGCVQLKSAGCVAKPQLDD